MRQYQTDEIKELAAALAKAQGEMTHAGKSVDNAFFKTKYADLSAVIDAAKPALAANSLSVTQITDFDETGNIWLITQLTHSTGQWMRSWYPVKPVKNDPQGLGSALTYARRYAYCAITGVAAAGEDDDGNDASGHTAASAGKEFREPTKSQSIFDSREHRALFVANCVEALNKAENGPAVKDQRILNLARWNAMKESKNAEDVAGYEKVVTAFNAAIVKYKEQAEAARQKPGTVEEAKTNTAAILGNDEIPF